MYLHLSEVWHDGRYLDLALDKIKRHLRHLKGRKLSYLCGDAGPLALGAVIYQRLGKDEESKDCIRRWVIETENKAYDKVMS